ncbi:permease [Streptococcus pyogenes]|nr:permease [Streptococcus pyogenes]
MANIANLVLETIYILIGLQLFPQPTAPLKIKPTLSILGQLCSGDCWVLPSLAVPFCLIKLSVLS